MMPRECQLIPGGRSVLSKIVLALVCALIMSITFPCGSSAAPRKKGQPITTGGFSVTPTVGWYNFEGADLFESGPLTGLKFGYEYIGKNIADSIGIEGSVNYVSTKLKTGSESATAYLFRLDALYPVLLKDKTAPYIVAGIGDLRTKAGSLSDDSPLFNYGVTVKYFMEDYLVLRADARHLLVYNNINTNNNFELSVGVSYYFGKERPKSVPLDTDGDGVPNTQDKCANTRKGLKVDKFGCPTDSDYDGVPEAQDLCPDTPRGVRVDKNGCPESAKVPVSASVPAPAAEGVSLSGLPPAGEVVASPLPMNPLHPTPKAAFADMDFLQPVGNLGPLKSAPAKPAVQLPPTVQLPPPVQLPPREKASAPQPVITADPSSVVGKTLVGTVTVLFAVDSSDVSPKYLGQIKKIADLLKANPGATALVEGHTDNTGALRENLKLSLRRAENLKRALVRYGVDPRLLAVKGEGPLQPVASNETERGRQKNRRAVTKVQVQIYR